VSADTCPLPPIRTLTEFFAPTSRLSSAAFHAQLAGLLEALGLSWGTEWVIVVGDLYLADISVPPVLYERMGIHVGPLFAAGPVVELRVR